jgi:hypothetical protein
MVVNFRIHRISRGARKLARTPTLIKKIHVVSSSNPMVANMMTTRGLHGR